MPCRTAATVVPSHLKPFLVGSLLRQLADHLSEACGAQQQHRLSSKLDIYMWPPADRLVRCLLKVAAIHCICIYALLQPLTVLTVLVGQGA